jgi:hypothetical protein
MNNLKQLSIIKNLLMDAKITSYGIEDLKLTTKLDIAMYNFMQAYDSEVARLRSKGKDGNDILLMIRD